MRQPSDSLRETPRFPKTEAWCLALLLLFSCGESDSPPRIESGGGELAIGEAGGAARFDFAENFAYADRWVEKLELNPNLYENRTYLTRGWSVPTGASDEEVKPTDRLWAKQRDAEILFVLREVADRTLVFWGAPFKVPGVEEYTLTVKWNGELLREGAFSNGKVEIDVPASAQQVGFNRLELETNTAGRPILTIPGSEDVRLMSGNVSILRLDIEDKAARARARAAAALLPEGVALSTEDPTRGEIIKQVSGSKLWYHLRVPEEGVFRAQVLYSDRAEAGPEAARFRVLATPRGGERAVVAESQVGFGESSKLEASLADLGGLVCRIEFEVEAADGSPAPILGWWGRPELLGAVEQESEQAPVQAQAAAREELKHAPVILFLLDATNPRFITAYGGREGLTPNLDQLASEGARFERAISQASYTISSVPSTMTSRYAWEHGAWQESTRLMDTLPTWPEAFREAGYQTHAIFCSPNGSGLFGNDRGFEKHAEVFREVRPAKQIPQAEDVAPILDRFLARRDESRPFLLWVHIIEPHEPYKPPAPWGGSLVDPDYQGRLSGTADDLWAIRRWQVDPTDEEVHHIEQEYEENLAYVDHVFGQLRAKLEEAGLFQDAVVGVFADHGEGFLAHSTGVLAGMGHGSTVYDEMTRIPMIMRLPEGLARSGAAPRGLVANFDLFPTVADLVGVPPLPGHHGRSFARQLFEPGSEGRRYALSHSASWHSGRFLPTFGLWDGDLKYIYTSGDDEELYDLSSDPGERHDLSASDPVMTGYLRQLMRQRSGFDMDVGFVSKGAATELDEEVLRQMQALGYAR